MDLIGSDRVDQQEAENYYAAKEPLFALFTVGDNQEETWGVFKNSNPDAIDGSLDSDKYRMRIAQLVRQPDGKQAFDWTTERRFYDGESKDMAHEDDARPHNKTIVRLTLDESGNILQIASNGKSTLSVSAHSDAQVDPDRVAQLVT